MKIWTRFRTALKNDLFAGLFILVPTFISIWFMIWVVNKIDQFLIPEFVERLIGYRVPGLGIILVLMVTILVGAIARNFLGRKFLQWHDRIWSRVPLGGSIYLGTKQLLNAFRMKDRGAFRRVVLLEYPRNGVFALAFVTGEAAPSVQASLGHEGAMINVFLPTTPNPTSGFFLIIPEKDTYPLDITVPEGFRLIISAGMVSDQSTRQEALWNMVDPEKVPPP